MKIVLTMLAACALLSSNAIAAGSCDGHSGTAKMKCCQNNPKFSGCK